jgi:TPR repeat protein
MSYIIEIAVLALPDDDRLAWQAADALRASQEGEAGRHPVLVRLHDVLTAVYPCMSRYPDGDPPLDECPWSDGPLIDNVGSRMAVFGLNGGMQRRLAARFVVDAATMLGLTVLDPQVGKIYRPDPEPADTRFFIAVEGVAPGGSKEWVASQLAQVFGRDPAQVRAMLDLPRAIVRTGLAGIAALQYSHMLLKFGCNISMAPEVAGLPIFMEGGNRPADLQRLRAAAERGQAQAQCALGMLYWRGIDGPQDSAQAVGWFEPAARQGNRTAQKALALCYQKGDGVPMSHAWALEWMRMAAEQGDVDAQAEVGWFYLRGQGVAPDVAEALRWFGLAARQGHVWACYRLGQLLRDKTTPGADLVEAAAWLEKAATAGNADAQAAYGDMFWSGQGGLPRDRTQAFSWFLRAAEQGNIGAMGHVSLCYEAGEGVSGDDLLALRWCRKAAEAGNAWAQVRLGRHYEDGDLLPHDTHQAFAWYERAARQDYADAQGRLAAFYLEGWGGDGVDGRQQALFWLRKAAGGGDELARAMLARLRD